MRSVGLLGTGLRSDIIAHLLDRSGVGVKLWPSREEEDLESFPESVEVVEIDDLAENSLIFVCMPIHRIREAVRKLGDALSGRHALVHTTRTLEYATLEPISEILRDETPTRRVGFVTGPMRRDDVLEDRGASAVCSSPFPEVADMVEEALSSETFRVYRNDDLPGTEAAAAYARTISVAYGMADRLGLGCSVLSTLFARGLDEMSTFVTYQGGYENTTYGIAGAGNLHCDTTGEGNTDFRIGRRFIDEGTPELEAFRDELDVVEDELFGFLDSLISRAKTAKLDLNILEAVERSLVDGEDPEETFRWLMELPDLRE